MGTMLREFCSPNTITGTRSIAAEICCQAKNSWYVSPAHRKQTAEKSMEEGFEVNFILPPSSFILS
jgi:hypothetical protein